MTFDYLVRAVADALRTYVGWLVRPRLLAHYGMWCGLAIVGFVCSGWAIGLELPTLEGPLRFSFDTGGGTPTFLTWALLLFGFGLLAWGPWQEWARYRHERDLLSKKRVLVLEARGLRFEIGRALADAVPDLILGRREPRILDFRQIYDGEITHPERGLEEAISLPNQIRQAAAGADRGDFTVVYGGLAPVPYTFLTGVLIDDEGKLFVMDWDRTAERWRALDAPDDGKRFEVEGLDSPKDSPEAVMAVAVSYPVLDRNLESAFPKLPVVRLTLEDGDVNAHWSAEKQAALAEQFLDAAIALEGCGVRRIHLVLAAPNSLVVRLGRAYDRRNLPALVVWQFERDMTPPYPWGIEMPLGAIHRPAIVRA
ncbi:MAG: 2-methylthioadenine synthetase [Ancylobacter novellus]|jgi:hypothetical protein|uniref:2-methylthioadenine synthetase n=1 Tax=Ancylobacter novellus TaxID=921 RepID=A0A2W5MFY6_ANCNO|nr:MAG: 2-methylthioadenine synthetase [Ancylobacter novellus]